MNLELDTRIARPLEISESEIRLGGHLQVLSSFFHWLETRRAPFPPEQPEKPPATLSGFIFHYARPFWPLLLASSLLSTTVALIEVSLFSFVGKIVDWLATADR